MALVSYDCSDSSDYEEDGEHEGNTGELSEVTLLMGKEKIEESNNIIEKNTNNKAKESLPPPIEIKSNFNVVSWDLLSKCRTQPIRISVPSLEDVKDNEESKPKLKPSSTKSGLFAILPKPKQQLLVPQSIGKRSQDKKKEMLKPRQLKSTLKPTLLNKSSSSSSVKVQGPSKELNNDDEEEEDGQQLDSFFFLPEEKLTEDDNKVTISIIENEFLKEETPVTINENVVSSIQEEPETSSDLQMQNYELSQTSNEMELNKEALEKLCGRSRGKRLAGDVEMVDVSGSELVGDANLWLSKDLTTQKVHFKRAKFDPLQRRKHQITFLAAQAREQELELSNQWSTNRMTRKQTQAKYGF